MQGRLFAPRKKTRARGEKEERKKRRWTSRGVEGDDRGRGSSSFKNQFQIKGLTSHKKGKKSSAEKNRLIVKESEIRGPY